MNHLLKVTSFTLVNSLALISPLSSESNVAKTCVTKACLHVAEPLSHTDKTFQGQISLRLGNNKSAKTRHLLEVLNLARSESVAEAIREGEEHLVVFADTTSSAVAVILQKVSGEDCQGDGNGHESCAEHL
jgi:hypothetical protein